MQACGHFSELFLESKPRKELYNGPDLLQLVKREQYRQGILLFFSVFLLP